MKEIPLTQGKVALVDDADFDFINSFKWYAKDSKASWYAVRNERINRHSMLGMQKEAKKKRIRNQIRMHNAIVKPKYGEVVHHINSNGLDCQRHNMKITNLAGNNQLAADRRRENQQREEVPF